MERTGRSALGVTAAGASAAPVTGTRVVIENLPPSVGEGRIPIKRTQNEAVHVMADMLADGHDLLAGELLEGADIVQRAASVEDLRRLMDARPDRSASTTAAPLRIGARQSYVVEDLLDDSRSVWQGEWNYVTLDPAERVAHILVVRG